MGALLFVGYHSLEIRMAERAKSPEAPQCVEALEHCVRVLNGKEIELKVIPKHSSFPLRHSPSQLPTIHPLLC